MSEKKLPWAVEMEQRLKNTELWDGMVVQAGDEDRLRKTIIEMYANINNSPSVGKLQATTFASQVDCLRNILSLGLSCSPLHGFIYLVPYSKKDSDVVRMTVQTGYKADVAILRRSDKVEIIAVQMVCENDKFEVEQFTAESNWIKGHLPALKGPRGQAYGYYAIIKLKGVPATVDYMPRTDVEAWRDKYARKPNDFWAKHFDQMAYKTVLKQALRYYEGIVPDEIKEIMVNADAENPIIIPKSIEDTEAFPDEPQAPAAIQGTASPLDQFAAVHGADVPGGQDDDYAGSLFGVPVS